MEKDSKKSKSIKKNFVYNLIYQIFLIVVPVVVTPYLSRVLQSDGIGQFSFSSSVVSYFTLFAALGFSYYAQRAIAKHQNNKDEQSKIFWEICIIRVFSTVFSFLLLLALAFLIPKLSSYKYLLLILSANVLAIAIDTTFIFQGNEDFKQISIRNVISKTITICCIFIFVKTRNDLWIYTLIQGLSPVFTALMMIPFLRKYLVKVKISDLKPLKHLGPCLRLFIPTIAVSIYTMLDKTMIGIMIPGETVVEVGGEEVVKKIADIENGFYNQAEKIIKVFVTTITALGTVMIPRNAYYFANGQEDKAKDNVWKALKFAYLLALPMMAGVLCVARIFAPWFFGDGYEPVPILMMLFSPLILAIGLNNVFGIQYLIPSGQDTKYTISVTCGAALNLLLNLILIYYFKSVGATIASVSAEFFILLIQIIMLRKVFNPLKVIGCCWKYLVSAAIMFVPCFFMGQLLQPSIVNTLLIVVVGVFVYGMCLIIFKEMFVMSAFAKIRSKFTKKKPEGDQP